MRLLIALTTAAVLALSGTATAGPTPSADPVTFRDKAGDARPLGGYHEVAAAPLSWDSLDVVGVTWRNVGREYEVRVETAGAPSPEVNYYPYALIGQHCRAYFIIRPGLARATVNEFCDDGADDAVTNDRAGQGGVLGSPPVVDGRTISARFSRDRLSPVLRRHRTMGPLGVITCEAGDNCRQERIYDTVEAPYRFTV